MITTTSAALAATAPDTTARDTTDPDAAASHAAAPHSVEPGLVRVGPSAIHGLGLFAERALDGDAIVGRLEGILTDDDGTHVLWLSDTLAIDISNDLRFVNHSHDPNCVFTELGLFTLRSIEPGEELTHDYGW
ncbi:MAG: SET domain-containing protein-lysine N-methyltransferase [Actinomycetota bacterium]